MATYKLEILGKLPSLNDYVNACRYNRFAGAKMKADVETNIMWQMKEQMKNVKVVPPVKLVFTWIEENNKRDLDNIASAKKFLLDSIVKLNILEDDSRKFVSGFTDNFPKSEKSAKVYIEIIELDLTWDN